MAVVYEWRGRFDNPEVNALHAEAFDHRILETDWRGQVQKHSLGWVCGRRDGRLIGFVNVAWDGGVHAFILDTMVSFDSRREGIGKALVAVAVANTRETGVCEWLHVDFEEHLRPLYCDTCGFTPTNAGLIAMK